jgi:integrase
MSMNAPQKPRRIAPRARKRPTGLSRTLAQLARQTAKASPSLHVSCDDEAMPPKIARVLGPYRNGDKWRLVIFEDSGRKSVLTHSLEEAEKTKARLLQLFEDRSLVTIGDAIEQWLAHKEQAGIKPVSVRLMRKRLRPFLPLDTTLGALTPQHAAKLYLDETKREGRAGIIRPATHHKTLVFTKELFSWAVEQGFIRENPFVKVKPIGRASAGKLQLREDEARRLNSVLIEASEHDNAALALLVQLVMALRSGEVLGLRARDLDADSTVLVVEGTKTRNARRRLEIKSAPLRDLLSRHCAKLTPSDLIFGNGRSLPYHTNRLHKALQRYCVKAGVPVVCPHSLRGLHSSLAVTRGASSKLVAEALGHGTDAVTRKHYISPEAMDSARTTRIAEALAPKPAGPDLKVLEGLLRQLAPEHLEALLTSVGKAR